MRAIITGAMGGVGQAVARQLASQGFDLALWYHRSPPNLVAEFINGLPGTGHSSLALDLTDMDAIRIAVESEEATILVHAAVSPLIRKNFLQTTVAQLQTTLDVDVRGSFALLSAMGARLKDHKDGAIIVIGTAALEADEAPVALTPYLIAKAAINEMARELRLELGEIPVHVVAPDFMVTGLQSDLHPRWLEMLSEKASGKLTTPTDVAMIIGTLCGSHARKSSHVVINNGIATINQYA